MATIKQIIKLQRMVRKIQNGEVREIEDMLINVDGMLEDIKSKMMQLSKEGIGGYK